jgi:hypothetical protein
MVLSDSPCERIGELVTFSDFERGPIIGARSAGKSVAKTITLLAVSRATIS